MFFAGSASAHASEQGFVLLLPTDVYIAAGGATVALTVVLLAVLPGGWPGRSFEPASRWPPHGQSCTTRSALLATVCCCG